MTLPAGRGAWLASLWTAALLLALWPTAQGMWATWGRSETFAHGYLIAPISLWLVWRLRVPLGATPIQPLAWRALLLLPVGLLWLIAALVDVAVVQQLALVTLYLLGLWTLLGTPVCRLLLFPLGFLYFMVPMGEGLVPVMMDFTADFTVWALQLSRIPVYREGLFFSLPSGNWSVVEACSGVRYLIASVTLGCMFAYLSYTRWHKRLLFVLAAFVMPVIANGLRAYIIVLIGHFSGMELAVGVDHLIYGWLFFGLVIFLLFAVGSIWRDPEADLRTAQATAAPTAPAAALTATAAVMATLLPFPVAAALMLAQLGVDATATLALPERVAGWEQMAPPDGWRPEAEGPDAELLSGFRAGDREIYVYLAHYAAQRPGHEVTTSSNRVSGADWRVLRQRSQGALLPGMAGQVHAVSLRGEAGRGLRAWSWFRVGERYTSNRYVAKLWEVWARISFGRLDAAWFVIATPLDDNEAAADALLAQALSDLLPALALAVDTLQDEDS